VISVVIPAYNSAQTLPLVIERTRAVMRELGSDCEFIVADDASRDETWTVLERLSRAHGDVRAFRFRRNFGQHNALLAGIRAARGETIVTLDDDLQHPPEEIPSMLAELERGADVVYGFPQSLPHSFARNFLSAMTKIVLQKAMGADAARHHSGFRLFRTSLRDAFANYDGAYVNIDVMLTWATMRFSWVAVQHNPRAVGKSNYTIAKLFTHALTLITGFSTLPLRVASIAGLAFTLLGTVLLAFVVGRYFIGGVSVPGFAFIASAITMFSGVQLFALGVMGEYLARIHMRTLGRPAYVIGDVTERTP
jgi:undecaprenyl-phosphate 4-deoxy-4-formamido-L-arabinose transferase